MKKRYLTIIWELIKRDALNATALKLKAMALLYKVRVRVSLTLTLGQQNDKIIVCFDQKKNLRRTERGGRGPLGPPLNQPLIFILLSQTMANSQSIS